MTDMPVDFIARPAKDIGDPLEVYRENLGVRRRCPRQALLDAECRGAPDQEIRLLEEAAIAASIAEIRHRIRRGERLDPVERARYERDCELLRRFPESRRGPDGRGWFDLPAMPRTVMRLESHEPPTLVSSRG
ncbi:hypothetical protein [Acidothermus cellulolyticus]|nr:hypothetical protein [Acidothermus cellulolyticus]